jgi:tetratricopeptide (TPR) repeat protein
VPHDVSALFNHRAAAALQRKMVWSSSLRTKDSSMPTLGPSAFRSACTLLIAAGLPFVAQAQQDASSAASGSVTSIESLIRSQDYDHALQLTKSRLSQSPKDFRLWTLEGIIFSIQQNGQQNRAEAIAAFDKALAINPAYAPALEGEVQLLYADGDKRAIPLIERILKADPKDQTAHEMLATLERQQNNCKAAADHFALSTDSIQSHPASLEAYGYCLVQLQRMQDAIPVFQQLVELLPERAYLKYDLAVVLAATKQNDAAVKVLEPLLTPDQQDTDILSLAAEAYEAAGDTPKAAALMRQAIVLSPATANYYVAFASLCLDHQSFQVGIDMLDAGLARISNDPALYISRGLLYAQLAQFDKAEADFNKAEQLDSTQSLGSYAVDLAELAKNDPDAALARVRKQLKAHPESALLYDLLAELLMNPGPAPDSPQFQEALHSAQMAIRLKPDLVPAHDALASIYLHSAQYNLAIEQCRIALKYSPSDQTAAYHLLIALRHSGQSDSPEIKTLVKQLSEMHQASMKQESDRNRYRLVEPDAPAAQ